jgi:hypothetical protein
MDLLGPSLEDIYEANRKKIPIKTVLKMAAQLVDCMSFLHMNDMVYVMRATCVLSRLLIVAFVIFLLIFYT